MSGKLTVGEFSIATSDGVERRMGWYTSNLGLHKIGRGWRITHLNTGLCVMTFRGRKVKALGVMERVDSLDVWDFSGPDGWRNRMPDLPARIQEIYTSIGEAHLLIDIVPDPVMLDRAAEVLRRRITPLGRTAIKQESET